MSTRDRRAWAATYVRGLPTPSRHKSQLAAAAAQAARPGKDAHRIAHRFRSFEDLILRFATRTDLDILTGLADLALVESYLFTAAKWGAANSSPVRDLINGSAWMPPGLESAG